MRILIIILVSLLFTSCSSNLEKITIQPPIEPLQEILITTTESGKLTTWCERDCPVIIFVDTQTYNTLKDKVHLFAQDIAHDIRADVFLEITDKNDQPVEIWNKIHQKNNVQGVLFVGDIPVVQHESKYNDNCYVTSNNVFTRIGENWTCSISQNNPETWHTRFGKQKETIMQLSNYFDQNHAYRTQKHENAQIIEANHTPEDSMITFTTENEFISITSTAIVTNIAEETRNQRGTTPHKYLTMLNHGASASEARIAAGTGTLIGDPTLRIYDQNVAEIEVRDLPLELTKIGDERELSLYNNGKNSIEHVSHGISVSGTACHVETSIPLNLKAQDEEQMLVVLEKGTSCTIEQMLAYAGNDSYWITFIPITANVN